VRESFLRRCGSSFFPTTEKTFGKAYRASCGHRKYGLFYEDLFIETPAVTEALRRLPDDVLQGRLRRMKIASQCYITHSEVDEPVTEEQDLPYLTPYLTEVEREDHDRIAYWQ
jgi:ubiquinol-cytochrome c reductase subunit 7